MTAPFDNPKANAAAAKAYAKAARPWYKKKRFVGLGVIVVIVIAVAASKGGGSSSDSSSVAAGSAASAGTPTAGSSSGAISHNSGSHPASADIKITSCEADDTGFADAKVVVTNHTSKTSDYSATVTFTTSSGQQLGTGSVLVNDLKSGQSSTEQDANSLTDAKGAKFTCEIGDVTRFAS